MPKPYGYGDSQVSDVGVFNYLEGPSREVINRSGEGSFNNFIGGLKS